MYGCNVCDPRHNPCTTQPEHPLLSLSPLQSVDTVCTLYQSFQEGSGTASGGHTDHTKEPPVRQGGASGSRGEATLLRPCPKHMSDTERLCKVIQELVDTEKSYVKVRISPLGR